MSEELNITEVFQKIKSMNEENGRLKSVMGNYVEYANQLKSCGAMLLDVNQKIMAVVANLDPLGRPVRQQRSKLKPIYDEIYNKLVSGQSVSYKWISQMFPNITQSSIPGVFAHLKKMPNVKVRRDGMIVYLYI